MKYEEYITNGNSRGRGPAQIDSDLAEIRWEMSETLHLLEDKFSPRALLDQLFSRARGASHGSSEFIGNLGETIRNNPVPVLLLASGVVSLLAADRKGGPRATRRPATSVDDAPGEDIDIDVDERVASPEGNAESMKARARELAGTLGERAHDLRERAGEQANEFGERAHDLRAHARERGHATRERVRDAVQHTRERGSRSLEEEPLIIVGLGLAVGALLGAGVPVSERERHIIGRKGERLVRRGEGLIDRAKEGVQEGVVRAEEVATRRSVEDDVGPRVVVAQETPIAHTVSVASGLAASVPEPEPDDVGVDVQHPSAPQVSCERPDSTDER